MTLLHHSVFYAYLSNCLSFHPIPSIPSHPIPANPILAILASLAIPTHAILDLQAFQSCLINFTSWSSKLISWVLLKLPCRRSFDLFLSGFLTYFSCRAFCPSNCLIYFCAQLIQPNQIQSHTAALFSRKDGRQHQRQILDAWWLVHVFSVVALGARLEDHAEAWGNNPLFCWWDMFLFSISPCLMRISPISVTNFPAAPRTQRWGRSAYDYAMKPGHRDHMDIIKILAHHLNGQPMEAPSNLGWVDVVDCAYISNILTSM